MQQLRISREREWCLCTFVRLGLFTVLGINDHINRTRIVAKSALSIHISFTRPTYNHNRLEYRIVFTIKNAHAFWTTQAVCRMSESEWVWTPLTHDRAACPKQQNLNLNWHNRWREFHKVGRPERQSHLSATVPFVRMVARAHCTDGECPMSFVSVLLDERIVLLLLLL